MEGVLPSILCCNCGITIEQNPSNMCISCIRDNVDITAEIAKKMTIHTCRTCKRWDGDVNDDDDDDYHVMVLLALVMMLHCDTDWFDACIDR